MAPRWLSRRRNVRAFDSRSPHWRTWIRGHATAQGLDPDRVENLARWLARDTDPLQAWRVALRHLTAERDAMAAGGWIAPMRRQG